MKSIFRKLIVGFLTFVIGVSAYSVWHRYNPVSLCDIEKHPTFYSFGEVHIRAVLVKTRWGITAMSNCSRENSGAGVELAPDEVSSFPLAETDYSKDRISEREYLMDAVIVGQMDGYIGLGCFGPRYSIKNVRVERVIEIREFENSDKSFEWLKSNSY